MGTTGKVKARWTRSFYTNLNTQAEEERYTCDICQKDFSSPSSLGLHSQVHIIERRYRCESCQVSFHSLGHLQKHIRSTAHESRSQMTQSFGVPTSDNPRPYGCPECDTAFRKHGHLAKHLRSKSHITRLESRGLLPVGTYAALEKSGQDLKDRLATTNYEISLVSMRDIAMRMLQNQLMLDEQTQQPPPQQQPQPHQPAPASSYGSLVSEPSTGSGGGGGSSFRAIDNRTDLVMAHFASSSAQQQPILSPGYYSSSSLSPPPTQPPVSSARMAPSFTSAGLPATSLMLHHHQHSINPIQDQAILQHLQHHHHRLAAGPIFYPNDLPSSQLMLAGHHQHMTPQHQEAAHSLDYTIRRHQHEH